MRERGKRRKNANFTPDLYSLFCGGGGGGVVVVIVVLGDLAQHSWEGVEGGSIISTLVQVSKLQPGDVALK